MPTAAAPERRPGAAAAPALNRRGFCAAAAAGVVLGGTPARAQDAIDAALAPMDQLHAIVVLRDGIPVFERRLRGPALDVAVNVKSVSKTLVATMLGIAIGRGVLPGVTATLGDTIPDLIPPGADPQARDITLEDLVSLRAGLERTSGPNYGGWIASENWVADALRRPLVAAPGGPFLYSTGSFHILGAALAHATGRDLLALSRDWLGAPLGLDIGPWSRDPQGYYLGGNNMALSPRGMARFGEMVRLGGVWQGDRVVPREWIAASFVPRARSPFSGDSYGYGWFLRRIGGHDAAYARGYGGQAIWVIRGAALSVAVTSDPTLPARSEGHFGALQRLVADAVLPAFA